MDLINELAFILSKNKPQEFDALIPEKSKIRKLFDLVTSHQVKTDSEASQLIYNTEKPDKKYLMLKRNLVQKLSDLVYLQNYEEMDKENYMNVHFQVEKELLIAEKLLLKNVYHNPTKIIAKVEQTAKEYYFIDIQVAAAKKFRAVYALKGYPKETELYDEKVKQLVKFQNYYNASQGIWEKLYSKTKFSPARSEEVVQEATENLIQIKEWLEVYNSPFIRILFYRIQILLYQQLNDSKQISNILKKFDKLLSDFPFVNTKALQLDINYYKARYFKDIGKLHEAIKHIHNCLQLSDYRAFDKFLIQELHFDILVKTEDYKKAGEVLNEVNSVPQFQFLNPLDKSNWVIREAYLFILYNAFNKKEFIQFLPIFSEQKALHYFLEKTKKSGKDKYGYNLSLLIIRVILFKIHKLNEIENEGNNMLVYYHRYLKQIENNRTVVFFQQLAKSASQGFEIDEMYERKAKLTKKLEECASVKYDAFEIIPYVKFWELLILVFN